MDPSFFPDFWLPAFNSPNANNYGLRLYSPSTLVVARAEGRFPA